ncbi:hypothetical protein ONZ45_g13801 [Pleurotus djamor]|nr:hypothetical protein ONZ45_g13801 [Pleurotus djamor]
MSPRIRSVALFLLASSFSVLEALAATMHEHEHGHPTHTTHRAAAHATHHSSAAHRGKQLLKLILGIVIGCVIGTILLCVCCCLLFRRHRRNRERDATAMEVSPMPPISAPISSHPTNPALGEANSYYHPQTTEAPKYGYTGGDYNPNQPYQQGYQNYQAQGAYDAPPVPPPPPQAYAGPGGYRQ